MENKLIMSHNTEFWVTSAVEDKTVRKAICLAASLRKVFTSRKICALTTLAVSKDLRAKLNEVFDLVILLERDYANGLNLEEYAKLEGFSSLRGFTKCVYLAPETLVVKNCDEIFDKGKFFAAYRDEAGHVDFSVYVFTPSMELGSAMGKMVKCGRQGGGMCR